MQVKNEHIKSHCAWYKCSKHSSISTNKNVSIKLRLKLFDSTVTPSALFGLCALPISQKNMSKLGVCQNKMLRKIVGWVLHGTNEWESVMRIMKSRVTTAMDQYYIRPWNTRIQGVRKTNF